MTYRERQSWRKIHTIREKLLRLMLEKGQLKGIGLEIWTHLQMAMAHIQTAIELWPDQDVYRPFVGWDDVIAKSRDDLVRELIIDLKKRMETRALPGPFDREVLE